MTTFIYNVHLWDETGNKLLEARTVKVKRANQQTAYNYVRRKFKYSEFYEVELHSTI